MQTARHILRIGLGITFLWIGLLIFRDPEGWTGFLRPWVANLLPAPREAIQLTAVFDFLLGVFLLANFFTTLAAALAAIHLLLVLIVSGINDITVRDIGLLAAALALGWLSYHQSRKTKEVQG
jgi:uncharacterized membrane protein YphA (DoxX/SURF4 family)